VGKKGKKLKLIKPKPTQQEYRFKFVEPKPKYRQNKPIFGFNHYLCDSKSCSFKSVTDSRNFHILFRNLKGLSSLTWQKIIETHEYHAHEINWNEDNLPNDIKELQKNNEIKDLSLFQFKAFDNTSRIIGLFNYNCIFEIIGIDKDHNTYR
jgi:hypothetical protein